MWSRFTARLLPTAFVVGSLLIFPSFAFAQLEDLFGDQLQNPPLPNLTPPSPAPSAPAADPPAAAPLAPATDSASNALDASAAGDAAEVTAPNEVLDAPAADELPTLTLPQWTRLGSDGSLAGRVVTLDATGQPIPCPKTVVFIVKAGRVVARVKTDDAGEFNVPRLNPGVVTVIAQDAKCFAAYALTLAAADGVQSAPLTISAISPWAPARRRAVMSGVVRSPQSNLPATPVRFSAERRDMLSTFQVALDRRDGFEGRIMPPGGTGEAVDLSTMMIRVVRGGEVVAEGRVGKDGAYRVAGVGPGPAGVIAFGPAGFAAVAVNFVPAQTRSAGIVGNDRETLVTMQAGAASNLNFEFAPAGDVAPAMTDDSANSPTDDTLAEPLPLGPPPGAPGAGAMAGPAGGFGGGGGGSGSGGLGGIGGLAAAGAVIAAVLAADDNNDSPNFAPVPVSPAVP